MNSDGQVLIDSKIDSSGMEAGAKEIIAAMKELTGVMKEFVASFTGSFDKANNSTAGVVKNVDKITESISTAKDEAKDMQAAMDKITFSRFDDYQDDPLIPEGNFDIYGNDVDKAIAKTRELEAVAEESMSRIATDTKETAKTPEMIQNAINLLVNSFRDIPLIARTGFDALKNSMSGTESSMVSLQDEIDRYTDALYYAEQAGYGLGDAPYDEAYQGLHRAKQTAEEYRRKLTETDAEQKKVSHSSNKMRKSLKKTNDTVIPLTKSIFKLGNMLKLMLVRMAMRKVIEMAKEGFQNLAQYSNDTNVAISSLLSGLTQLKNAFATAFTPILEAVSPALTKLIGLLAEATTWVAQLFAALTGKDTFVKAIKVQEDYAESIKDTAKEAKKAVAPFDDLVQLQSTETKTGVAIEDMFTTEEVTNQVQAQADAIKDLFDRLFDPLKNAWDKYGSTVVDSIKNAFGSLKNLVGAVGESFLKAWNDLGYGERITGNLLQAFANLANTVAILADRFREAWETGGLGDSIMRHLLDIVETLSEKILRATEIIKAWAGTLDFTPILTAFDNLLQAIDPLVDTIGDALLWLLEYVLLPLASWTIEDAMPAFFNLLAAALKVANAVLLALKPLWQWFWDKVLQPIAKFVGDAFISFLNMLTSGLEKFSQWCSRNQGIIQGIVVVIASFFAAWAIVSLVSKIATLVGALITFVGGISAAVAAAGGLGAAIAALVTPIGLVIAAVGLVIAAIVGIAYNWDKTKAYLETSGQGLLEAMVKTTAQRNKAMLDNFKSFIGNVGTTLTNGWASIKEKVAEQQDLIKKQTDSNMANTKLSIQTTLYSTKETVASAWSNIVSTVQGNVATMSSNVSSGFSNMKSTISGYMGNISSSVQNVWNAVTTNTRTTWGNVVSTISSMLGTAQQNASSFVQRIGAVFNSMINIVRAPFEAIRKIIETVTNAIVSMVERIAAAVNKIKSSASSAASSAKSAGVNTSSFSVGTTSAPVSAYSSLDYNMPRLATGTVVPPRAGEFAAILGDNNRDYEVVSPVETMKQAFKDAITEMGGLNSNQTVEATMTIDGNRFGRLVARFGNQENQRIGVRMVTEGV